MVSKNSVTTIPISVGFSLDLSEPVFSDFCSLFEKVYLSHELGLRKPHPEVFTHILDDQGLKADETLFIDDSIQHVQGAVKTGLHAHHLKDDQTIDQLFP